MAKKFFTITETDVLKAANLLEGLARFKQLKEDVRGKEIIGFPVLLSTGKQLIIDMSAAAFNELLDKNIREIYDELEELGVEAN